MPRNSGMISVVVPCYNEEAVLHATHERIGQVLDTLVHFEYEIIYVDDGSRDDTAAILRDLQATDGHVRVLRFSRNFGHQVAVSAGIEHASGDAIVLIDADLQDPPELIPEMLARWGDGYDVAFGQRLKRVGESRLKLATAKVFYRVMNRMADVSIPLDVGDFRLMDRRVVDALLAMPERDRYVRGMVSWVGFSQIAVPYERDARVAGESKYPLFKMLRFALDGITSFSVAPLRIATLLGFAASAVALLGVLYALVVRIFTRDWVPGWAGILCAILFMGGIQLISLGVIGEYIGRIYGESKRRPLYVLREQLGFAASPAGAPRARDRLPRGVDAGDGYSVARSVQEAQRVR
jgi:dolichol-phosphate mannosyltransferase